MTQTALFGQTFYKTLGSTSANETAQCSQATPDGNYAVGGSRGDSALIVKVDPFGNVLWAKCFKPVPDFPNLIYQIASTPDGYLIGCGSAYTAGELYGTTFLFKFDLAGNMIWQSRSADTRPIWTHRIIPNSAAQYMSISEIYDTSSPTWSDPCIGMVNAATGLYDSNNPRLNYIPDNTYIDDISSSALGLGQAVYSCGRTYLSGSSPSGMRLFITKFGPSGGHLWSKYFMFSASQSARIYGSDINYSDDSLMTCYTGDINGASSNFSVGLIRTDTAGNVAWTKDYKLQGFTSASAFTVLRMPYGFAITGYAVSGNQRDLFVIATGRSGQVLWAKTYGNAIFSTDLTHPYTEQSVAIGDNILLTGTQHSPGNTDIILTRVDGSGDISCGTATPVNITVTDIPPYSFALTPTEYPDLLTFFAPTPSITDPPLNDLCASVQLDLGPDTATCGPITLNANVPSASYLWSTGSTDPSIEVSTPGTVWVEATIDCCTYTDTINISPSSPAIAAFSSANAPCSLSISTINTSIGASSYHWDFGDGQTSIASQPTHTYDSTGTYNITLTVTNGCGSHDTTETVELVPVGSFSIEGPDSLCANATGAYTSDLVNTTLSGITWSTGQNTPDIMFSGSVSTNLFAIATDTNNCTYSDTLFVYISPAPNAAFTFDPLPCDSLVSFTDGSANATSWSWDLGNGENSTMASPIGHYGSFGTFVIEQVAINACGSDTTSQQLTLGPTGILTLAGPDSLCSNEAAIFSAGLQGPDITTLSWSMGTSDSTHIGLSFSSNSVLSVIVIGDDGCTYADSLAIQVFPAPSASFTVTTNPCDSSAAFINTSLYADTYSWNFGNGSTSTVISPVALFDPTDTFNVMLAATNGCGTDTAQQVLVFEPVPLFQLIGPARICSDDPLDLHLSYGGSGLHNLQWSTGDTTEAISLHPGDGEVVEVSAINDQGCLLTSSYTVRYVGDDGVGAAYIPNVFTPNMDGLNEAFAPVILEGFISMTIFNRWGKEIYETTDITKPWRGDHKGSPVPDGTYVYIVKWDDTCARKRMDRIGHVTLLR